MLQFKPHLSHLFSIISINRTYLQVVANYENLISPAIDKDSVSKAAGNFVKMKSLYG